MKGISNFLIISSLCCFFIFFNPLGSVAQDDGEQIEEKEEKKKKEKKGKKKDKAEKEEPKRRFTNKPADRYGRVYGQEAKRHHDYDAPFASIKFYPAIYWNSYGLEYEQTVSSHFTVALRGYYNTGTQASANFYDHDPRASEQGFLVDLMGKFYFHKTPQKGPYLSLGASYGDLLLVDGSFRPWTLFNTGRELEGVDESTVGDIPRAQPFHFQVSGGYQISLLFRKITGNIQTGVQASFLEEGGTALQFFVEPGIGITIGGGKDED